MPFAVCCRLLIPRHDSQRSPRKVGPRTASDYQISLRPEAPNARDRGRLTAAIVSSLQHVLPAVGVSVCDRELTEPIVRVLPLGLPSRQPAAGSKQSATDSVRPFSSSVP
jgi:hypothetical protein